jgi:hypothetical protein
MHQKTIDYYFKVAISQGTYATPGLAVSFSGLVQAPGAPLEVRVWSAPDPASSDDVTTAYRYRYLPDADDQNGGTLQILTGSAAQSPAAELANGTTPLEITGGGSPPEEADAIYLIAKFLRG